MEGRRRLTIYEQMSADGSRDLAGLSLEDILGKQKRATAATNRNPQPPPPPPPPPPPSRTLLDIIKDDDYNKRDRRSWKAFKDKIRLKRAGSAWKSSIPVPASDIQISGPRDIHHVSYTQFERVGSVRYQTPQKMADDHDRSDNPPPLARPQMSRRMSSRYDATIPSDPSENPIKFRPQMSRNTSSRMPPYVASFRRDRAVTFAMDSDDDDSDDDTPEVNGGSRQLSAREAVAAQEASEAAAAAAAAAEDDEDGGPKPVTMSLMDLLEETDRAMGLEGSTYRMGDDDEEEYGYDDDEEEEEGGVEYNCCVCMVRHKGSAFAACGHTFCRLCSREMMVQKGSCPLCNNFLMEILNIF